MAAPAHSTPAAQTGAFPGDATVTAGHSPEEANKLRRSAQALGSDSLPAEHRFEALEELRARAIALLPSERSHYLGKPLPLADDERRTWEEQVALWQTLYFAYALCTDIGGNASTAAAVWQRALDCLGRAMREHARAYRVVPASLWKELNSCYRAAEACGVAATAAPVDGSDRLQTCKSSFLTTLLHEAANVYALSPAQLQALEQALPEWLELVELSAEPPPDAARAPLAIDIGGETGARVARGLPPNETVRYIDSNALATRLRELAASLRASTPAPEPLLAMHDLPRTAVERLLTHLYVQWCSAGTGRIDDRRDSATRAQVAVTMHAVHFQISGRAFRQPGLRYTREEEYDLATFGHITERTEHRLLTGRSSALEPWEIINQSQSGSLGMLRKPDLQSRIGHGQLIAVRTSSANAPILATVQRLKMEPDGSLSVGVRVIRGEARGAAVRPAGNPTLKYDRALVVSDEDNKSPQSVIVPRDQFAPGALIDMHLNRSETMQLGEVIERGWDFERMSLSSA
jgi:hypothetical protein